MIGLGIGIKDIQELDSEQFRDMYSKQLNRKRLLDPNSDDTHIYEGKIKYKVLSVDKKTFGADFILTVMCARDIEEDSEVHIPKFIDSVMIVNPSQKLLNIDVHGTGRYVDIIDDVSIFQDTLGKAAEVSIKCNGNDIKLDGFKAFIIDEDTLHNKNQSWNVINGVSIKPSRDTTVILRDRTILNPQSSNKNKIVIKDLSEIKHTLFYLGYKLDRVKRVSASVQMYEPVVDLKIELFDCVCPHEVIIDDDISDLLTVIRKTYMERLCIQFEGSLKVIGEI